ncbi:MAG: hypothetical protein V3W44_10700 [Dehalococcoidales bacterium]
MPTITFSEAIGGPVPMVEIEINLSGAGGLPSGGQTRSIIVVAEKVSAGSQVADTVSATAYGSGADGIAAFGTTSPGAAMIAAIYDYYNSETGRPRVEVWGACIDEDAGSTAAVQTMTMVGNATAAGTLILRIGGKIFRIGINNGMLIADQALAIRDAFNNALERDRPPLIATAALGVCTFTATVKGSHMNNIAMETVDTGSIATTTYTWSDTTMGGAGGTAGIGLLAAGDFTAVIAALTSFTNAGQYVIPWTELGNAAAQTFDTVVPPIFRDHVISQGAADNMIPATLRMGYKTIPATAVAAVAALDTNDCERVSLAVSPYSITGGSGTWDGEVAARYAAMRATEPHLGRSFDGLPFSDIATSEPGDVFTRAELTTLLNGGCSPLNTPPMGDTVQMVRDVSCRIDLGMLDTQAMDSLDYIREDFQATLTAQRRMSIVADDADLPPVDFITQPKVVKGLLRSRSDLLAKAGYMTNVAANWPSVTTNLSGSTLQIALPIDLIPALHSIMARLDATVPPGA